jgi:hypothetical protein
MQQWLLLVYKLPAEPTRHRASVWRALKAAGAIYLQNGVAALPAGSASERVLRGLVQDVLAKEGTAYLVQGAVLGDEARLLAAFAEARDAEYGEVLSRCRDFHAELDKERAAGKLTFAELEENEEDLAKLAAWLDKIVKRDPFGAPLRGEAERALAACRDDLDAFATSVYAAVDHGSATRHDD